MLEFTRDLIINEPLFWFCALSGLLLFIVQLILSLVGAGIEGDEGEAGQFKWLSKQALTGFLMIFGLAGLTCKREYGFSTTSATAVSLIAGSFACFVTGAIFRGAKKLKSPGTVFRIDDAIGKEAMVYQRIAKGKAGKFSLSLNGFTYEIDPMARNAEEIPSFLPVRVVEKFDENTVIVTPLTQKV